MHSHTSAAVSEQRVKPAPDIRGAVVKVLILVALAVWALWPEMARVVHHASENTNWSYALASPVVLIALLYCRRRRLAELLTRGSVWGAVIIVCGFAFGALLSRWPLTFGYAGEIALVPVLSGIVLAVCGWGVLKRCVPLLLIVVLSIPLGQRMYAGLIIRPENGTLSAARVVLDGLPGVDVQLDGQDLIFDDRHGSGTIALGESNRGASLFFAYVLMGVFVVFARIRPVWQVLVLAVVAIPIALLCNLLRMFTWGIMAIYAGADPTSAAPRAVATVVSLLAAYLAFAVPCAILPKLFVEADEEEEAGGGELTQTESMVNEGDGGHV